MSFYHRKKFLEEYKDRFQKILIKDCKEFPIKTISNEQQEPFFVKVNQMLSLNKHLQAVAETFQRTIQRRFELEQLSTKLQSWYELTYTDLIKELQKKKVKLTLSEEAEWEPYFVQESIKALSLKEIIQATDKEIDQLVYALYGLTDDEIRIVEGLS